jgi:hypothetical protein
MEREGVLQPNVVAVLRQGAVESLLLARTVEGRVPIKLGYLTIWRPKVRTVDVLHEGFVGTVTPDGASAALKVLMGELNRGKADRITFSEHRDDSFLVTAIRQLPGWFWRDLAPAGSSHWAMALPEAPGEFLRRMKSKHRSWIKNKTRDLEAKFPGAVRCAMFSRPEEIRRAMVDVEAVAAKTYLRGMGKGFKNDEAHIRQFEMESKAGTLRIFILYGADAPLAYWTGCVYRSTYHSGGTGYDPALRDLELGTLVLVNLIDHLCGEKVKVFDFGLGDAFYKKRFADQSWNEVSLSIYRLSPRGAALKLAFMASHSIDRFLRLILSKLKLMDWVKRTWRAKMAPAAKEQGK